MPGSDPIDPEDILAVAQDPAASYVPAEGGWRRGSDVLCPDAQGRVVLASGEDALHVDATTADLLARSSGHTSTTFTTSGTVYALHKIAAGQAQAVAV